MPQILVLAKSGFGKTTSLCGRPALGIKGLNPKETFVIQCVKRNLPSKDYILCEPTQEGVRKGNRVCVADVQGVDKFKIVATILSWISSPNSPFKNIVIDDFNYLMQDYYMANAMKGGWDTPKIMGYGMGLIFDAFQKIPENKNLICMAHYEEYKDKNGDSISYKFKSCGKMVDDYITPEGKFDIVLFGKSTWLASEQKSKREFVKEFDGEYPAKDSLGVLDDMPTYFPNDLSIVVDKIKEFYGE